MKFKTKCSCRDLYHFLLQTSWVVPIPSLHPSWHELIPFWDGMETASHPLMSPSPAWAMAWNSGVPSPHSCAHSRTSCCSSEGRNEQYHVPRGQRAVLLLLSTLPVPSPCQQHWQYPPNSVLLPQSSCGSGGMESMYTYVVTSNTCMYTRIQSVSSIIAWNQNEVEQRHKYAHYQ